MKRFFLYLGVSLLAVIAADRLLALAYDALYRRTLVGQTGGKVNQYLYLPQQPALVVMGNSRAYYQVIPDSFAVPTFNLCHAGMSQIFQTGLLNVITTAGRLPGTILLHLDPVEYTDPAEQLTDIQNLKHYYGHDTTVTRYTNQLNIIRPLSFVGPWLNISADIGSFSAEKYKYLFDSYRYNGRVINLLKNVAQTARTPVKQLGNGYDPIIPTDRDSLTTLYSAQRDTANPAARFHPERLRHLRQFLAMCKAQRVRVIGFTSPLYARPPHEVAACQEFAAFLRAEGILYIDYVSQPLASVQGRPRFWKDSHHLNELGAQLQSQDMARRVNALLAPPALGQFKPAPLAQRD